MTITVGVARSPKEIDDALWLRHQVYVVEEGLFKRAPIPDDRIVDKFDVVPKVAQIVAYDDDEPVGGIRVNCDMGVGLPPERYFDFSPFKPTRIDEFNATKAGHAVIASGGMLAVRKKWRNRRDVILALYKAAAGVFYAWDATHIIATVSHSSASAYPRMGFRTVAEKIWSPDIGDFLVPILAHAKDYYRWAFRDGVAPEGPIGRDPRHVRCRTCKGVGVEDQTPDQRIRPHYLRLVQ